MGGAHGFEYGYGRTPMHWVGKKTLQLSRKGDDN